MKVSQYVTVEEVKRVCKELKISDWTKKKTPKVSPREAKVVLSVVNKEKMKIDLKEFLQGGYSGRGLFLCPWRRSR